MNTKKGGGSFGIPQDVLEAVQESKDKAKGKKPSSKKAKAAYDSESIPEVEEEETSEEESKAEADQAKSDEEELLKQIAKAKEQLGIEITEDDLWVIFMGGQLEKDAISVIPGKLEVTFKTLSVDESQAIDKKMAEALEEKFLEAGYRTLQTKHLLAAGVVRIGKPGKGKPLGDTEEERFKQLGSMSTMLVERIAQKWNQFTWLVNECVNLEMDSGKS